MAEIPTILGRGSTLFRPTAPLENLKRRAALYRSLRAFFDDRAFIETTTPTLSRDVVVDRFVEAIPVEIARCWSEPDGFADRRYADAETSQNQATTFYLQTSPEFAMKRLIASGMDAIYQLAPAFRKGDRGTLHNIEFTMLEWYRVGDDYKVGRELLAELIERVASDFYKRTNLIPQEWSKRPVVQLPFADPFKESTGIDPLDCEIDQLRRFAERQGIPYPESYLDPATNATKDDWIDLLFSEVVQPRLGFDAPALIYDYPASQSQLAKTGPAEGEREGTRRIATKRFELFVRGVELANGYDELLDASVLRARNVATSEERRLDRSPELPRESRLLAAMDSGLPQCSGCALGVDRYLLVLLGLDRIDDVIAFPTEIA